MAPLPATKSRWSTKPFVAPKGIYMVRIDRVTGKRVLDGMPSNDPKSSIIWEAFKAESEARTGSSGGDATKQRDALIAAIRRGSGQSEEQDSGADTSGSPAPAPSGPANAPRVP